jgi:hypothetical protein
MPGRRLINSSAQLRSLVSNAALAVQDRVVWRVVDGSKAVAEVVKWPFERVVWAIERGVLWPLGKRTGGWDGPLRAAGIAAVALLAAGAGVLGLVWASGSGGGAERQASAPAVAPVASTSAPTKEVAQATPVLHGAAPDFTPKAASTGATAKAPADATGKGSVATTEASSNSSSSAASSETTAAGSSAGAATASEVVPAGPAATKVGRRFAGAFVLYETGRSDARVRTTFAATATPQLSRSLLRRPPRLPANVKVPKAKVLNMVPGPQHGDTYTLSVSLLRVGITSELRIDMQRDKKTGEWRVTDVLG